MLSAFARVRTEDLLIFNQPLYLLSYKGETPEKKRKKCIIGTTLERNRTARSIFAE